MTVSIGAVLGDDLMDQADELRAAGLTEMFSGAAFPDKLMSMNAYLGARRSRPRCVRGRMSW